jgi:SAM-dependent methyltransferase
VDWSAGSYEHIAAQLLPAARVCIDYAAPAPGERVIDVGCGTGNAALLAAERSARVTGVDPAARLLEVAGERARARGLEVHFIRGEAASLPLPDASADLVVSVFGVIFASDAQAAAAELARVAKPDGRIVLCAWIPEGALYEVIRVRREAMAAATGGAVGPPPFAWHDADALSGLFAPFGLSVALRAGSLPFTAASPQAFIEAEFRDHPMWVAGRAALEPRGEMEAMRDRALRILDAANEEPDGFQVNGRFVMATLLRG